MPSLIPQLVVDDARGYLEFLGKALGGETLHVMPGPDGKSVMHAAVRLQDARVFVSDASEFAKKTTANVFLYVSDVDAAYERATAAGAQPVAPVSDMFWGDRWGMVADPSGNLWQLATHVEDVTPEQLAERMRAANPGG
ncbi:MAG: VOC family protein [Myxococcales bacterium]|nr:VOC family protein [Myxococcales bacterium]